MGHNAPHSPCSKRKCDLMVVHVPPRSRCVARLRATTSICAPHAQLCTRPPSHSPTTRGRVECTTALHTHPAHARRGPERTHHPPSRVELPRRRCRCVCTSLLPTVVVGRGKRRATAALGIRRAPPDGGCSRPTLVKCRPWAGEIECQADVTSLPK